MSRKKYTDEQFIDAVKNNFTVIAVLKELGIVPAGGNYKSFHNRVKAFNLDTSHFIGQGHLKGKTHNYVPKMTLKKILVIDSNYSSSRLKKRLVEEFVIEDKCCICQIQNWCNKPISLHLDHINGNHNDNRLENLRLLCPNCHSQTETYCRKNAKNKKWAEIFSCSICNKTLTEKRKTGMCRSCCNRNKNISDHGGT